MPQANRKDLYSRVSGKLGVARVRSDEDLAALVERRLPSTTVKSLIEGGLSDAEAYSLILPRRTYTHRVAKNQLLSREESDRAVRVARIIGRAENLFGEPGRAWRWLRTQTSRFGGKSPLEMIATEAGARIVEEVLLQVEHGIFA